MAASQTAIGTGTITLLNAVTSATVGGAASLEWAHGTFTMQTVTSGTVTTISCKLQGSLDGTTWYDLATSTSTAGDAQFAVDKPSKFIRANLGTFTGISPVVTVFCAAAA